MRKCKTTVTKYVCRVTNDGFRTYTDLNYRGEDAAKRAVAIAWRCIQKHGVQARVIKVS